MSLGNKLMALGHWIEKRFPEKLTAAEVNADIQRIETSVAVGVQQAILHQESINALMARVAELEKKAELFNSDINKTKVMLLTQRQTR